MNIIETTRQKVKHAKGKLSEKPSFLTGGHKSSFMRYLFGCLVCVEEISSSIYHYRKHMDQEYDVIRIRTRQKHNHLSEGNSPAELLDSKKAVGEKEYKEASRRIQKAALKITNEDWREAQCGKINTTDGKIISGEGSYFIETGMVFFLLCSLFLKELFKIYIWTITITIKSRKCPIEQ